MSNTYKECEMTTKIQLRLTTFGVLVLAILPMWLAFTEKAMADEVSGMLIGTSILGFIIGNNMLKDTK